MAGIEMMSPLAGVPELQPLAWIIAVGLVSAITLGFVMGANDIANAFGTSVGAGVLTIKQACLIAAIFDVAGSVTLGARVSNTIAAKIINVEIYRDEPGRFMLGMLSASLAATGMVGGATKLGIPVSTTHAVVGSVIGFSFVKTTNGLIWFKGKNGLGAVMLSWIVSPLFAGVVAAIVYVLARHYCFQYAVKDAKTDEIRREFAFERHRKMSAAVMGWVAALVVLLVSYEFAVAWWNAIAAFGVLVIVGIIGYFIIVPKLLSRIDYSEMRVSLITRKDDAEIEDGRASSYKSSEHTSNLAPDVDLVGDEYDPELEKRCHMLSVITASFMAFTHGANDISNAAGPLLAIWDVYNAGFVDSHIDTVYWIIIICCVGVVLGLFLWGAIVIRTVGYKITKITATRAFTIELGTATAVLVASYLAMPVSSTHCFIGAVIAVGIASGGGRAAVQWPMVKKILVGWVVTVPVAAMLSAATFKALEGTINGVLPPPGYQLMFVLNGTGV